MSADASKPVSPKPLPIEALRSAFRDALGGKPRSVQPAAKTRS